MNHQYRLPAEWEPQEAVILSWPHDSTDWAYMLKEVTECYCKLAVAIAKYARLIIVGSDIETPRRLLCHTLGDDVTYFKVATNDTWMRDYGPITTVGPGGELVFNDFKFNGWGLKFAADKDNLFTSRFFKVGLLNGTRRNLLSFVLEGGSIESDGKGTLLTTSECLLSPNRNGSTSKQEIEETLKEVFGVDNVLWLDHGSLIGDDTDSHIDTLARLAPNDTIIYVGCDDPLDKHYEPLKKMKEQLSTFRRKADRPGEEGLPYNLIELPLPDPEYDEDGYRLPATYANYLTINNAVLLPVYGQEKKDLLAQQIMKIAFPDYDIVPIDCSALIIQHGSLHCATMQLPPNSLKI